MESRNPVFQRSEAFSRDGYATFDGRSAGRGTQAGAQPGAPMSPADLQDMYAAPSATPLQTGRMTIDDVVMRTASIFAVLLTTAAVTYFIWRPGLLVILGAALVGFGLAMAISFSKTIRPPLIMVYAAVEGVFVGGISYVYADAVGGGIVPQAVLGTLGAFTAMLLLYKSGKVRATPKFTRTLLIAGAGYLVFSLVNLGIAIFTGSSAYSSPLGWLIAAFGVGLASFFLVLDFDTIERGIRDGAPQQFAWIAAFGLVVTLVWLYLEILRLLAILRGDN